MAGYFKRLFLSFSVPDLSAVEKVLLAALGMMLLVSLVDAQNGVGVGSEDALKMAKQVTQQEMMAKGLGKEKF